MSDTRGEAYRLFAGDQPLTYADVIARWQNDSEFRDYHTRLITDSKFSAVRWETPPITRLNSTECEYASVLLDCPGLDRGTDREAFAEHFEQSPCPSVLSFTNLRGDATMVVPSPMHDATDYTHLAAFLRSADEQQAHALWQTLGQQIAAALSDSPLWVSTAGMGVAWLHVRMDSRPKYYGHQPYRQMD